MMLFSKWISLMMLNLIYQRDNGVFKKMAAEELQSSGIMSGKVSPHGTELAPVIMELSMLETG